MLEVNRIYNDDCISRMKQIDDKSIDMILCDLPYGTTACKWDSIIPFDPLWKQYERIIKNTGAIVLTASQPFTTELIHSNLNLYKYNWVWVKDKPTNFALANKQPMKYHEDVCVFYKHQPIYNKQMIERTGGGKLRCKTGINHDNRKLQGTDTVYKNKDDITYYNQELKNPSTVIYFDTGRRQDLVHPTQKPIALFKYFILTYTNENEIVLDNCIGSGTTAIACIETNRNYIGIEKDKHIFEVAQNRINTYIENKKVS